MGPGEGLFVMLLGFCLAIGAALPATIQALREDVDVEIVLSRMSREQKLRMAKMVVAGIGLLFLGAALVAAPARAAPPAGVEPASAIGQWFQSLRDTRGIPCCSEADCRETLARGDGKGGTEVWIGRDKYGPDAPDAWKPVPDAAFLDRDDNPTGHVVACYYAARVHCFVAGSGT